MVPPLRRPLRCPLPGTPRLHPPGRAARGDHCREPHQGMHSRGHHARQPLTPRQTAGPRHDGHVSRCLSRGSSCFQVSLVLRPADFFTIAAGAAENFPRDCFSPTPQGGFCMPWAGSSFAAPTKAVPTVPAETTNEDRPLTSSALLPRPVLGGEPSGGCLRPWFVARPAWQHPCTPALLYTVYSPCI